MRADLQPAIVSHGADTGVLESFTWDGLRDYCGLLTVPSAVQLWSNLEVDRVRHYMSTTLETAERSLLDRWWSDVDAAPSHCHQSIKSKCGMTLVALPAERMFNAAAPAQGGWSSDHASAVQDALYWRFKVEVPVKCVDGHLYCRISAHIYNCAGDYEVLARAVEEMASDEYTIDV